MATPSIGAQLSALPVYERVNGHMVTYWSDPSGDYNQSPSKLVRVLPLNKGSPLLLTVTFPPFNNPLGQTSNGHLQGIYYPQDNFPPLAEDPSEICTESLPVQINPENDSLQVQINLLSPRTYLPWGLRGTIKWKITLDGTTTEITPGSNDVELYFVSISNLPTFLYHGLPISFFRRFLLPLRKMTTDNDFGAFVDPSLQRNIGDNLQGWITYVIEKLHFQPNMRYETSSGQCQYFFGENRPISFDAWVSDCDENIKHPINCYDLAGLAQTILPLGFRDASLYLQMKHSHPFGYINTTDLIGWGSSDSPLGSKRLLGANDPARRGFGSHVFLTVSPQKPASLNVDAEKALDATCRPLEGGPVDGRSTISAYMSGAIDNTTTLTGVETGVFEITPTPNPTNWGGVASIWTSAEVFHTEELTKNTQEANVITGIASNFPDWSVSKPNLSAASNSVSATYSFVLINEAQESMSLRIIRSPNRALALEEYTKSFNRISTESDTPAPLSSDLTTAPEDLKSVLNSYQDKAFSVGSTAVVVWKHYNFVMELHKNSSKQIDACITSVAEVIENLNKADAPNVQLQVNGGALNSQPLQCKVGEVFTLTVTGLDQSIVNVEYPATGVLYLSSSTQGSEVQFKFLARMATTPTTMDEITFITFNGAMNSGVTRKVQVMVN